VGDDANLKLMADLFAEMAGEVTGCFGEEGEAAVRRAVRRFGRRRGETMARRVLDAGKPLDVAHYMEYYDMARAQGFSIRTDRGPGWVEQVFAHCPLWATWEEGNRESEGYLYCLEIDAAIVEGYNPRMRFIHHCHFRDAGYCHMRFEDPAEGDEHAR